jgi:hypothetical protein
MFEQAYDEVERREELERMREKALEDFDKNRDDRLDLQVGLSRGGRPHIFRAFALASAKPKKRARETEDKVSSKKARASSMKKKREFAFFSPFAA